MEFILMLICLSLLICVYGIIIALRNFISAYRSFGNKYA